MTYQYPEQVLVTLRGGDEQIKAALEAAVRLWNTKLMMPLFRIVPKGTPGAVIVQKEDVDSRVQEAWADLPGENDANDDDPKHLNVGGNAKGLRDEVTLAHELGHILGLQHPHPESSYYHYVPVTRANYATSGGMVAPVGLMGNGARGSRGPGTLPNWPKAPTLKSRRDMGPTVGEVRWVRNHYDKAVEHAAQVAVERQQRERQARAAHLAREGL